MTELVAAAVAVVVVVAAGLWFLAVRDDRLGERSRPGRRGVTRTTMRDHLATVVCAGVYLLVFAATAWLYARRVIQHPGADDHIDQLWLVLISMPWSLLGVALPAPLEASGFVVGPAINLVFVTGVGVAIDRARRPRPPTTDQRPPVGSWPP